MMQSYDLYLNGQWQSPAAPLEVVNPSTGQVFATVGTVERQHVVKALDDAAAAMPAWAGLTGQARGGFLHRIADELGQQADAIAEAISLENGKPLAQAQGEVGMTIDHFRWFAEEARRTYGRVVPHQADGKRHLVLRKPVGVVGAIAPWNFPLVLAVRKVAPALAAGCPVILKPASATPVSSVMLAQCMERAKLPAGVFQLVLGKPQVIADVLMESPVCRKVSFTGSTEVGRKLIHASAATITELSLELGGHAPFLVFKDADLEAAVQGAMIAKFRNSGQSCIAANRIYVQQEIYEAFLERFVTETKKLKVGDGFTEGVDVGPLINEQGLTNALEHIEQAVQKGAKLLCGGKRWGDGPGWFLEPTVLSQVPAGSLCMCDETFAPVAPVCSFETEADAIRMANDTPYGLAAYAYTRDLNRALRVMEALEAGTVGINESNPATSQCPFGGVKQSGLGRELGIEGLDAYLETTHVSIGGVQ